MLKSLLIRSVLYLKIKCMEKYCNIILNNVYQSHLLGT